MKDFKYPKSFPDKEEEIFLRLLLSDKKNFPELWRQWKNRIVFNQLDHATSKLIPFLHLRLKESGIEDNLTGRIQGAYKFAWYKNLLITESLRNVVSVLNKENIPVLLLKGIPLLINVYRNTGARALGDADIFIDPKIFKRASDIMHTHNWTYSCHSPFSINNHRQDLTSNVIREITFINSQNVQIDMHWSLFLSKDMPDNPMSFEELFRHSIDVDLKDVTCKMPCYEDMIIHIVIHGAEQIKHRTLRWVLDVISIIGAVPVDWKFLIKRIKQFDVAVELNIAFSYLIKNYSVEVPDSFMRDLSELPLKKIRIKQYYRKSNRKEITLSEKLLFLWKGYRLYEHRSNLFTSWYYFIDFVCKNRGITKKRYIPAFVIGYIRKNLNNCYENKYNING